MRPLLAVLMIFQVTSFGPERNFAERRDEAFVCRQYELALSVTAVPSIKLGELCHGWR